MQDTSRIEARYKHPIKESAIVSLEAPTYATAG
jgi:hypothetical protein